ncbi:TonB-dependent receptor [Myroides odoratimimus]|uniref:SusC/RagA family TonB-linked outer membrane protein n=1 Tax=Myroides odoratimimus TaxID=76832 RepID=UPI00257883DD|nr:TonB-dependent receptor [Myroides odoratimimus]MDM1443985.1 TonB-dependent receptor [Myroides odoratimimus]
MRLNYYYRLRVETYLFCLSLLSTGVYATNQTISDKVGVHVYVSNTSETVKSLFEKIELQTTYKVVYSPSRLDTSIALRFTSKERELEKLLEDIALRTGSTYNISDKFITFKSQYVIPKGNKVSTGQQSNKTVLKGVVKDIHGLALPGATVKIKESTEAVATDLDGSFMLEVAHNKPIILVIEYIGYDTKEIKVENPEYTSIVLEEDARSLEEIVITGYTTESKRNITAAISTINVDGIKDVPKADVAEMLQGRASGVQVMSDNSPGGGNSIRIRGFSTINNNEPLVIVDGVPVANGLNSINSNDIASMQVLKDAASSSIYGSRAANGVILITTKSGGRSEKISIDVSSFTGVQSAFNLPKMLDAQEYGDMLWQAYKNDGVAPKHDIYGNNPTGATIPLYLNKDKTIKSGNVDWVKEIFNPATIQSHNISLAKGGEYSSQLFSLGYFDQQGIIKDTYFKRFSGRFNSDYRFFDGILTIGENLNASYTENVGIGTNAALGSIVYNAFMYPSIVPVYNELGEFSGNPLNDIQNPRGRLDRNKNNKTKELRLLGNLFGELKLIDFTFRSSIGLDYVNINGRNFSPKFNEILVINPVNSLSTRNSFNYQFTFTNTLSYKKQLGNHNFDVLLGQEAVEYYYEGFSASRQNFMYEDPNYWFLDYGTANQLNGGNANGWSLNSFFGKVHYNYDGKYIVSATMRRDGTSRLANHKWDTFPAVSLGWRIDREEFFDLGDTFTSFLLRGGWGVTGNQQVPSYSTIKSYSSNSYNSNYDINGGQSSVETGLIQSRVPNPELKWETTTQSSLGVDLGFFNDKLSVTADIYNKKTKDILVYKSLPLTYGGTNDGQWVNDGEMTNRGLELNLSYQDNIKDLHYNINFNFTTYKNQLTALNSVNYLGIPSSSLHSVNFGQEISRSAIGQPIGSFFGYVNDGIFKSQQQIDQYKLQPNAKPGDLIFKDVNNDGVIDDNDRTFIGSPHPDFILGFNVDLKYKGFDLSMFFNGSFGNKIYNLTKYNSHFFNQSAYNKSSDVLGAWTPDNPNASIPRLSLDDTNNNIRPSSYYVEDGSYFKLNNLQLGYSFGEKLHKQLKMRVYLQATNVFTITNYSGLTPEVGLQSYSKSNKNLDIGIDRGLYPPARTFSMGLSINY